MDCSLLAVTQHCLLLAVMDVMCWALYLEEKHVVGRRQWMVSLLPGLLLWLAEGGGAWGGACTAVIWDGLLGV
jgi:hypothetical protein